MRLQPRAFIYFHQIWRKQTNRPSPHVHLSSHHNYITLVSSPRTSSPSPPILHSFVPTARPPLPLHDPLHGLPRFLLVLLTSLCLIPHPAHAAWFRVGVVGPWGCDPIFGKALPYVAAQLAVNRINRDPSLTYAVTFDYAVLQVVLLLDVSLWI